MELKEEQSRLNHEEQVQWLRTQHRKELEELNQGMISDEQILHDPIAAQTTVEQQGKTIGEMEARTRQLESEHQHLQQELELQAHLLEGEVERLNWNKDIGERELGNGRKGG